MIEVNNVSKYFGEKQILHDINTAFEEGKEATVSFDAPAQGFYALDFDVKAQTVVFKSSNVPIALEITKRPQSMYRDRGEFYFAVPEAGRRFSFFAGGERLEQVYVKVFTPSGKLRKRMPGPSS